MAEHTGVIRNTALILLITVAALLLCYQAGIHVGEFIANITQ